MGAMGTKERPFDRGTRLARADLIAIGRDIRTSRLTAGLTQRDVGRGARISYTEVGRVERGVHAAVSVRLLSRVAAAVGLDLRVRAYPGSDPLRDSAHAALLTRLRPLLGEELRLRLEVPLGIEGDLRAWDGVLSGFTEPGGSRWPVEAETRLYDLQAQLRRIALKASDAGIRHVLVVIRDTKSNRAALRAAADILHDQFPLSRREVLAALRDGRYPGASAILLL
jgi:transcriptional regulator with XRE-family HTH domain